jgi:SAM-dependent methyltransferase
LSTKVQSYANLHGVSVGKLPRLSGEILGAAMTTVTDSKTEGALWGAQAKDWADIQEPTSIPLWNVMLDATGVTSGTRFLDVGCGAGGAELLADERGAVISGVDAAPNSIALAKDRIPGASFQVGDMQKLPFEEETFDTVISVNCIQFVPDAQKGVSELARVCKAGSKVSIAVFGEPSTVDENVIFSALADLLPPPKPTFKEYRFSAPGRVKELMRNAGITDLVTERINTPFIYPDPEIGYRGQRSAGSLQEVIDAVGEVAVKDAIFSSFERFTKPDGTIHMNNDMIYVTGTRT